jgi:hypothetical protein
MIVAQDQGSSQPSFHIYKQLSEPVMPSRVCSLSQQPIVYFLQFNNSFGDAPFYSVLFFFYRVYEEYSPVWVSPLFYRFRTICSLSRHSWWYLFLILFFVKDDSEDLCLRTIVLSITSLLLLLYRKCLLMI